MILLLFACAGAAPGGPAPVVPAPPPVSLPSPEQRVSLGRTPKLVYEACRERLELPEVSGECAADVDCAALGCSGEVCTVKGTDLSTACDHQPCFDVLDRCGCVEGVCAWSVKIPTTTGESPRPPTP